MFMDKRIKARCLHAKNIGKTWSLLVAGAWGFFWAADAVVEKYDPYGIKVWWDAHTTHLPSHWQTWLTGLLLILLLALVEGSFRQQEATAAKVQSDLTKQKEKIESLETKVRELEDGSKPKLIGNARQCLSGITNGNTNLFFPGDDQEYRCSECRNWVAPSFQVPLCRGQGVPIYENWES
jgi:hypothetical protein